MPGAHDSHAEEVQAFLASSHELVQSAHLRLGQARASIADDESRTHETDLALQQALLATGETLHRACEELQRARRLLEREHAKAVDSLESQEAPTLITDRGGAIRDANRAAAVRLGLEHGRLPGRLLVAFVARQDVDRFRTFARPLWNGVCDDVRSVVVRIRPRGGVVAPARLSVAPVRSLRQNAVGMRWTIDPS